MKRRWHISAALLLLCILASSALPAAGEIRLTNDVAWCKASEAYKCCVQQAYLNAMRRLRELVKGEAPGSWCVVLDADETVISNVPFQAELQASGKEFSSESWNSGFGFSAGDPVLTYTDWINNNVEVPYEVEILSQFPYCCAKLTVDAHH